MRESMSVLVVIPGAGQGVVLPKKPLRVIGIDLGTTNSTVAELHWDPNSGAGPVRCIEIAQPTTEGEYTHVLVPSVVAVLPDQVMVGEGAKRLRPRAVGLGLVQNQNLFYECKNDIGILRTYHKAPKGFRSAAEIGGHVLAFLKRAAEEYGDPIDQVVVTVPASFQAAQRADTLRAAELAGIPVVDGNLLDEPVAAFLDYLATAGDTIVSKLKKPKRLMVFDFGGGTCDIAVFRARVGDDAAIAAESLAVSRYHRLGGGDIDAAIVYSHLIPELCRQNGISERDLGFEDKKRYLEPALLGIAEALKMGLCSEIRKRMQFGRYEEADKAQVASRQPGQQTVTLRDQALTLNSPVLTAEQFDKILVPFIDTEALFARDTEYTMTCSILAPVRDALDRADLKPAQVDYCLLVGGSTLIPQVAATLKAFLPNSEMLTFPDKDALQTAVARGAAYHALALAIRGRGLITPVCHESISMRTKGGSIELVPKGAELRYPATGEKRASKELAVPQDALTESVPLRVELVSGTGDTERLLFSGIWDIRPPVRHGAPLRLEYSLDANQVFNLSLSLTEDDDADQVPYNLIIENPLTNVVNPQVQKVKIEEIEENLRAGRIPQARLRDTALELTDLYAKVGQYEKAIEFLKRLLRQKGSADAEVLNKIAIQYKSAGDLEKAERYYTEAGGAAGQWGGPWFNLALLLKDQNRLEEALKAIGKAMVIERSGPFLVLKSMVLEKMTKGAESKQAMTEGMKSFDPPASLTDWALGWFVTGARMAGMDAELKAAEAIQRRRRTKGSGEGNDRAGVHPESTSSIVRKG